ncbi:hypothetical protein NDU88_004260 [Pleurodeles waltl]|uniref:Uncharacterized protein n=1 Tax=Pleurodeles waltl TaxID=8319 RepID=A0AAV7VHR0_PLEWA|nr:hypothetical protein NDU88_004260 [Pleurodeles waltl]
MEASRCSVLCRTNRGVLGPCQPKRSAALSSTHPPSPVLGMLPARRASGVSPAVVAREPTDGGCPTLMPPFLLVPSDHLGPPPGLYLEDILWAQTERRAHASAIFTS